jgi:hypothetical protein
LQVNDVSGGAVIHNHPTSPGVGTVDVHYLAGAVSNLSYLNFDGETQNPDADHSYIQALFHSILNRNSTAAEMTNWLGVLQGQGRWAVAQGLEILPEALGNKVTGWYQKYFNQAPTTLQLLTWTNYLKTHSEESTLAAIFSQMEQLSTVAQKNAFILQAYQWFMGRAPSMSEQQTALSLLNAQPAGALVSQLLMSSEYQQAAVASAITAIMHRAPNTGEVYWDATAYDLRFVREMLESSQEFYDNGY